MTLKQFLSHCQFYIDVQVYADHHLIDVDSAYRLLHSECSGILSRYDSLIDYFTVCDDGLIVVLQF